MAHTVDSYSESNYSGTSFICENTQKSVGQSFTGDGSILDSAKFYIKKSGSPTGTVTVKIYTHSGTFGTSSLPTGSVLATSDTVDVSTLSTSFTLQTFSFSGANRITLSDTYYIAALEYTGGDLSNYVGVGQDNTSPTHGGNTVEYTDSHPGWFSISSYDTPFYIYGEGSSPSASSSPSSSVSPSASASPSPLPPHATVLRIAKNNVNALANSDPEKMIFDSAYGTLKYYTKQTATIQIVGTGVGGDFAGTTTYAHSLGYYPYVEVFVRVYIGSPSGNYEYVPFAGAGASVLYSANYKITTTTIVLYAQFDGVSSSTWNFDFIIFIYKNDLQLS